jgi:Xaa-Pro aminopeptidase
MFQTFDAPDRTAASGENIRKLKRLLATLGIEAFLIPRSDEYRNEYVPPAAERLKWVTGFSGSAGLAVIGRRKAALFVDGRYTVQAPLEVDTNQLDILQVPDAKLSDWLLANIASGATIGFDPMLHSIAEIEQLAPPLAKKNLKLKPLTKNPVDRLWGRARPAQPKGMVTPQPLERTGRAASEKIAEVQVALKQAGQQAVVLTLPDSVAWLFNIRGADVAHNPVPLAFAIVHDRGKPELFIDAAKIGANVRGHLDGIVKLRPPDALDASLATLADTGKTTRIDDATAAWWFLRKLGGPKHVTYASDPCILPKARKTDAEVEGARRAHLVDGVAVTRFLAWLDHTLSANEDVTEIDTVRQLELFRRETGVLRDISFDTIAGSGPNGAIVHYRVTQATNRRLGKGELFLLDSGGQYEDGTTDITRTIAIGKPTAEMRTRFTLVLEGHIAVSTARFPKGTTGVEIDALARRALWQAGLDFDHGTGHGVGSFLSVHEGPQRIAKTGRVPLEPGMIVSNEPGYYKQGAYGIRIETLLLVLPEMPVPGGERTMMGFETLTLAPIDRRLIDTSLLSPPARVWLDAYHARVRAELSPKLDVATRGWLAAATAPLA